jgi:hypothetical protein
VNQLSLVHKAVTRASKHIECREKVEVDEVQQNPFYSFYVYLESFDEVPKESFLG